MYLTIYLLTIYLTINTYIYVFDNQSINVCMYYLPIKLKGITAISLNYIW